ncbi:MAG: PIG-L family deacetylase [Vicinamibacterales bacterium]
MTLGNEGGVSSQGRVEHPPLDRFDAVAFGAHPDDLEAVMGGTAAKLVRRGMRVLFVDLCDGEPARHAERGTRGQQAERAAAILGVQRVILPFHDRLILDSPASRLAVAGIIRRHRPRLVFTTAGRGVHPDHAATTDTVVNGVFYARLPKWDQVEGGEVLAGTEPHEIERLFFGHCRMEPAWSAFDFAVDVSEVYAQKMAALTAYESVFSGDQASLVDKYAAEDRYVGSLVGARYAEAFKARSPLLVEDPTVFVRSRFG